MPRDVAPGNAPVETPGVPVPDAPNETAPPEKGPVVRRRLGRFGGQWGAMNPVLEPLFKTVRATHPKADLRLIERAYETAAYHHRDQKRKSGDPYITHPLAVATILAELGTDDETLCAALLHDTVEDTAYGLDELRADFGENIALLVDGVTKLDKVKFGDAAQAETVRKMVVAMSRDIRVLVIKLGDRLHNMRTMRYMPEHKRQQKSRETLEIFAPLAHRLGMNTIKWELEDLAFTMLFPKRYDEIARMVSERAPRRDLFLQEVIENVHSDLREQKIRATVKGRPKHYYSIYQKMIAKGVAFDDIYDLVGIRVLVDTVPRLLRRARNDPRPVEPGARPVQRLHSDAQVQHVPVAPHDGHRARGQAGRAADPHPRDAPPRRIRRRRPLEVQGGDGRPRHAGGKVKDVNDMAWLRQLLDWQKETSDPGEFLESLRFDLSVSEVFVFTPRGQVIALPDGATPVDFAYAVHTEVGSPMYRRPGQRAAGAAGVAAGQRRHGRDLHLQVARRRALARLAEVRQVGPGPQQDPPVVLQGAPRDRDRGRQGGHRAGDAQAGPAAPAAHVR